MSLSAPEMLQWAPIAVQLVGFGIAYGALRQQQAAFKERLEGLDRRMSAMDAATQLAGQQAAGVAERLKAAEADILRADTQRERLIDTADKTSRELIAFRATSEEQHKAMKEAVDSLSRAVKTVERQIANASVRKSPFHDAETGPTR